MKEELIIQQFYEKLKKIVGASYSMSEASSLEYDTLLHAPNDEHEKYLNTLKKDIQFWLNESLLSDLLKGSEAENKANILKKIKLTLTSLRNFIEHSDIYPDKEDEAYQNLIMVLKTPDDPNPINPETNDIEGLFYKDLNHNTPYWEYKGERHLILMNNLASFLEQLIAIHTDENHKEDCRLALEIIFTTNKRQYNVCAGGHNNNIESAKTTLSAKSPEENILSYWKKYKSSLMSQPFGIENKNLISRLKVGNQVHLPPAIDIVFGADKNLINKKDCFAVDISNILSIEDLALLRDQLYDFHIFLYDKLSMDIDSRLKGFDKLKESEKNNKIDEIMSTIVNSFWDKGDSQLYTLKEAFCIDETFKFKKAEEIKEIILDRLSFRIPKILGVDEKCELKKLKDISLSEEKKDDLLVKGPLNIEALKALPNLNIGTVHSYYQSLPIDSRNLLSLHLAFYKKEMFDLLMNKLNEEDRDRKVLFVVKKLLSNKKIQPLNNILDDYSLNNLNLDSLEELAKICIDIRNEEFLGKFLDIINEVDEKQNKKLKAFKRILLREGLTKNNEQTDSQSCLEVIAEKMPKNKRSEIFRSVLLHIFNEHDESNFHKIFKFLEKLNFEIDVLKMKLLNNPDKIIQTYLKYHPSIKDLNNVIHNIYNNKGFNDASVENLFNIIDESNDNKRFLDKISKYPKRYNFRLLSSKSFVASGIGIITGCATTVAFSIAFSTIATAAIMPLVLVAIPIGGLVGLGISGFIPGKYEFKNRKKIRSIKSYAALNLSLFDNKQKKFNKVLNTLKSEQQEKYIERLLAIAINQEQDNYAKLNTILTGIKSIKNRETIQRLFKDALVKHIGNENREGFMVLLNNVPQEGKNEIIGHVVSQCAMNANQEGFDLIMNREVSQEIKHDVIKLAVSQCAMNTNQEGFDLIMNSEVSPEIKRDAIKHTVSQCAMNANQEGFDLIMNSEVSPEIKHGVDEYVGYQCFMNENLAGFQMVINNIPEVDKKEFIDNLIQNTPKGSSVEGLLSSIGLGYRVPTNSSEGAGDTIEMRKQKKVMSIRDKGDKTRLLKKGKRTSRV